MCRAGWYEQRFPEIAARVPHFDQRMRDPQQHLRILTELTYFWPRDSKVYPPFLRYLLHDSSPRIRWEAASRLRLHGTFLSREELPEFFDVPLSGTLNWRDEKCLERFRSRLEKKDDPSAGWAASGLALAKDAKLLPLLPVLTDSKNVFVRYSAAMAYLELGERAKAIDLLMGLTRAQDDQSGYYRLLSAEAIVRQGRREYLHTVLAECTTRDGYADSGLDILEDLTGAYFASVQEWQAYLKYMGVPRVEGTPKATGD